MSKEEKDPGLTAISVVIIGAPLLVLLYFCGEGHPFVGIFFASMIWIPVLVSFTKFSYEQKNPKSTLFEVSPAEKRIKREETECKEFLAWLGKVGYYNCTFEDLVYYKMPAKKDGFGRHLYDPYAYLIGVMVDETTEDLLNYRKDSLEWTLACKVLNECIGRLKSMPHDLVYRTSC